MRKRKDPVDINAPEVSDHTLVVRTDIARYLGVSLPTVDRMRKQNLLPEPSSPKGMCPRWRAGDIRKAFSTPEPQS